jgi:regulatory protein
MTGQHDLDGYEGRNRQAAAAAALAAAEDQAGLTSEAGPAATIARRPRGRGARGALPPPDPARDDPEPDPDDVARGIVLRQLSMAPRSRQQLADKLARRGCAVDVADRVLDRMTEVGLVDDEAYAGMLVRSQQAGRGLAKKALAHQLRSKGVADETIEEALDGIDGPAERLRAEQVAAKAMRRLAGLEPAVQARRLAGVLDRKGYPPSVVYPVVRDAVNDAPEHRRD